MRFQRVKGTRDVLPREGFVRQELQELVSRYFLKAGILPILTPTFESCELYERSTGQSSDIVTKEMYRFKDMAQRELALRPEGTPSVIRAVLENNLKLPIRLWYMMPMFRQDKPQKGRYREHTQIGVEILGEAESGVDVELIKLGYDLFSNIGIAGLYLELNSIGCRECRPGYTSTLVAFLEKHKEDLCDDCKLRMTRNPLRVFDCKLQRCQNILKDAPSQSQYLCEECSAHFSGVKRGLGTFSIPYTENARLVRGLDYYSRTVIEFKSTTLGAQDTVCGGGRYDYLMEEMGGQPAPGIGFAFGVERALLASKGESILEFPGYAIPLLLLPLGERGASFGLELAFRLREKGIHVQLEYREAGLSKLLKRASARNARYVLIIGDDEIAKGRFILRNMTTSEQKEVSADDLYKIPELMSPAVLLTSGDNSIT